MNPEKEATLPITAILLIIGISFLLFTAVMKFLDGHIHTFFFRAGISAVSAGLLLEGLRFLARHAASGKKHTTNSTQ